MDWSEERYVRIYTRDTADLLAFGWEGRAVWWELMRKLDRSGVIDHGGDLDVVAELLRLPVDLFRTGIAKIAKRGSIKITETAIVVPNFLEAQEADQSDKSRQRESRARRRAVALAAGATTDEAKAAARPDRYPPKTPEPLDGSQAVTAGHSGSQRVTPSLAVPSLAKPSLSSPTSSADVNEPTGTIRSRPIPPEALELAEALAIAVESRAKDPPRSLQPSRRERTIANWADDLRLAHEQDGRSWERLRQVLEWSQASTFWRSNIRSGDKLREQFDTLVAKMDSPAERPAADGRPQAYVPTSEVLYDGYADAKRREAEAAGGGS